MHRNAAFFTDQQKKSGSFPESVELLWQIYDLGMQETSCNDLEFE